MQGEVDTDNQIIKRLFGELIRDHVSSESWFWISENTPKQPDSKKLSSTFTMLPRKVGTQPIQILPSQQELLQSFYNGYSVEGWTVDRLCRVYLLLNTHAYDKGAYFQSIEALFSVAEMNELIALYSALPLLTYPELWRKRCAEGIRSNIGSVLEAVMYHNPYPSNNLDQDAWNQMILKAFFTDKNVDLIIGLDDRANKELAYILSDYAHERWAANRPVNPQLWRLTGKFIDQKLIQDIKKLFTSEIETDRKAAALAVYQSEYEPAKELLVSYPELYEIVKNKSLTWQNLSLPEKTD